MKRLLGLILFSLLILTACSSESDSDLTLQDFIEAYEAEGVTVNPEDKPMFSLIKAEDGIIFYLENTPVKIYEYASEKDISAGEEILPVMSKWKRNGKFVLETSNEKAIEIFKSVK